MLIYYLAQVHSYPSLTTALDVLHLTSICPIEWQQVNEASFKESERLAARVLY